MYYFRKKGAIFFMLGIIAPTVPLSGMDLEEIANDPVRHEVSPPLLREIPTEEEYEVEKELERAKNALAIHWDRLWKSLQEEVIMNEKLAQSKTWIQGRRDKQKRVPQQQAE